MLILSLQKQKHLDMHMFRYFKNVRGICTDSQTQKFDSLMKKVVGSYDWKTRAGHIKNNFYKRFLKK